MLTIYFYVSHPVDLQVKARGQRGEAVGRVARLGAYLRVEGLQALLHLGCKEGFELNLKFELFKLSNFFLELSNFFELSSFHRTFFQQFSEKNSNAAFGENRNPEKIG